jgi:hypothetical protein
MSIEFKSNIWGKFDEIPNIECEDEFTFVYGILNKKNKRLKLGRSSRPRKRLLSHKANFMCYGSAKNADIVMWLSSVPIHLSKNPEAFLLKVFANFSETNKAKLIDDNMNLIEVPYIKPLTKEFYDVSGEKLPVIMEKVKEYISACEEL